MDYTRYFAAEAPSLDPDGSHAVPAKLVAGGASGGNTYMMLVTWSALIATAYTCPLGPIAGDERPPPYHCTVATGANGLILNVVRAPALATYR